MSARSGQKTTKKSKMAAVYHCVHADEDFATAAKTLIELVSATQARCPGRPRALFLDIEGHRNTSGAFDHDMVELQSKFAATMLLPYLTELSLPLIHVRNPKTQRDDPPDQLMIVADAGSPST